MYTPSLRRGLSSRSHGQARLPSRHWHILKARTVRSADPLRIRSCHSASARSFSAPASAASICVMPSTSGISAAALAARYSASVLVRQNQGLSPLGFQALHAMLRPVFAALVARYSMLTRQPAGLVYFSTSKPTNRRQARRRPAWRCSMERRPGSAQNPGAARPQCSTPVSVAPMFERDMRPRGEWQVYQHHR